MENLSNEKLLEMLNLRIASGEINLSEVNVKIGQGEWDKYKKSKGFSQKVMAQIEKSTSEILDKLTFEGCQNQARRGIVVGNVQSGKTTSMEALMSLGADKGFNLFIILSGTKRELKEQTRGRFNNLESIHYLDHKDSNSVLKPNTSYMLVCIKAGDNIADIERFLNKQEQKGKLKDRKILVIDDECDEASQDTNSEFKISTTQNRNILKLLHNIKCGAMNYIGYTATPQGAILNYNDSNSLFPTNFIHVLEPSDLYIGAEDIFRDEEKPCFYLNCYLDDDIDMIRDLETRVKRRDTKIQNLLPDGLIEAICYFYCALACVKVWQKNGANLKEPISKYISMMIHTSSFKTPHENLSINIERFIEKIAQDNEWFIDKCREVWEYEGNNEDDTGVERFKDWFKNYGKLSRVDIENKYVAFDNLLPFIKQLSQNDNVLHRIDHNNTPNYSGEKINLVVLNGNLKNAKNELKKLKYDTSEENVAPYIIVGGNILSRGLTLEGLVCSYFMRKAQKDDTLMQMGRWFGYRIGYELLPRIYLDSSNFEKFKEATKKDIVLRSYIKDNESNGKSPEQYIKQMPKNILEMLPSTNLNKSRAIQKVKHGFNGASVESSDIQIDNLKNNLDLVFKFLNELEVKNTKQHAHNKNTTLYKASAESFIEFVGNFMHNNEEIDRIMNEYELSGENQQWSILLCSIERSDGVWEAPHGNINVVNRYPKEYDDEIVVFERVWQQEEYINDIDKDLPSGVKSLVKNDIKMVKHLREEAGLSNTPQLAIHIINKNSNNNELVKRNKATESKSINLPCHAAVISINMPGEKNITTDKVVTNLEKSDELRNSVPKKYDVNNTFRERYENGERFTYTKSKSGVDLYTSNHAYELKSSYKNLSINTADKPGKYISTNKNLYKLAPSSVCNMSFDDYKDLSIEQKIHAYENGLKNLDPSEIWEEIKYLTPEGQTPTILCTCAAKGSMCHRHIVAKWLSENLGLKFVEKSIENSGLQLDKDYGY